ncbi:hypothetical protein DB346_15585 [Verrucomicrobia bacterium LW23]|nr:hypothetical protein DB346_15585 [Verrucomicrobia bacterium LW23]
MKPGLEAVLVLIGKMPYQHATVRGGNQGAGAASVCFTERFAAIKPFQRVLKGGGAKSHVAGWR